MHQINEDRQHRALLLSQRLKEISAERDALLSQLHDLEIQEKVVQRECNTLHNMDAPISTLPDEMLSMVFEAGTLIDNDEPKRHFGTLVSHVAHHWRHIALAIPQLWNRISFIGLEAISYSGIWEERAITFLSRRRTIPIDISVAHIHGYNIPQGLIRLIGHQMGQCRQISIKGANPMALEKFVRYLSTKAAPLLRSVDFTAVKFLPNIDGDVIDGDVKLLVPFLPSAPHLRTVQLSGFQFSTLHFCNPAIRSITSLRLTSVYIYDFDDPAYRLFRAALMALDCLNHFEFQPDHFGVMDARMRIVLPTLQHLYLDATQTPKRAGVIIQSFRATSLITLSLDGFYRAGEEDAFGNGLELNFPSLDHLILSNIMLGLGLDSLRVVQWFLGINRLTCRVVTNGHNLDILDILYAICVGIEEDPAGTGWTRRHKLRVLAVSPTHVLSDTRVDTGEVVSTCSMLSREYGLQKLLLPKGVFTHMGADAMGKLRGLVEVEDYWLDWPAPFAQCF